MQSIALLLTLILAAPPSAMTEPQLLARMKARAMTADYRADLPELARIRDELAGWPNDRALAHLARYWSGFASWRIAINGANHGMQGAELKMHLGRAASEFAVSMKLKDDFADAYAAAALVNSWLATFSAGEKSNPDAFRERIALSQLFLARGIALDPSNPRVLWARGAMLLFAPVAYGGSVERSIDVYGQMLAEATRRGTDLASPFPDWGRPEALMSRAYARLHLNPPDIAAARRDAAAALQLQPDWSYVRDTLMNEMEEHR